MSARKPPPEFELECGCFFVIEEARERLTRQCIQHSRETDAAHRASVEERAKAREALEAA